MSKHISHQKFIYLILDIRSDIILKAKEDKADDPDDDDDADYDEGGDEDENQQTIVFLSGCKMFQNVSPTILSYFYIDWRVWVIKCIVCVILPDFIFCQIRQVWEEVFAEKYLTNLSLTYPSAPP